MEKIFEKYAHDMLYHDSDGSNYPCRMVNIDNFKLAAAEIEIRGMIKALETLRADAREPIDIQFENMIFIRLKDLKKKLTDSEVKL